MNRKPGKHQQNGKGMLFRHAPVSRGVLLPFGIRMPTLKLRKTKMPVSKLRKTMPRSRKTTTPASNWKKSPTRKTTTPASN